MKKQLYAFLILTLFMGKAFPQDKFFDAVKTDNYTEVAAQLDAGYDIDTRDSQGFTGVLYAATSNNLKMLEFLLKRNANPDIRDIRGMTPLHWTAHDGLVDAYKMLVAYGANWYAAYQETVYGDTKVPKYVLNIAGEAGQQEMVNVINKMEYPITGRVLITLIQHDEWGLYLQSLEKGCPVNETDCYGATALMYATATQNYERWMKHLIDAGANPLAKNKWGQSVLHYVAQNGSYDAVELMKEHKADLELKDSYGQTPLMMACWFSGAKTIGNLLDAGANPNVKENDGDTPLIAVLRKKDDEKAREIIELLIDKGADVNIVGKDEMTPLCEAVVKKKEECVKYLLKKGADVNYTGASGWTPIMQAVYLNNSDQAKFYLELLLDKKPTNLNAVYEGRTALEAAKLKGHTDCVEMLQDAGAK